MYLFGARLLTFSAIADPLVRLTSLTSRAWPFAEFFPGMLRKKSVCPFVLCAARCAENLSPICQEHLVVEATR
jgi:hypothetical protein